MAQSAQAKKPKKRRIIDGVDTHGDAHHAAVVLLNGTRVADVEFPATAAGYVLLLTWLRSFGRLFAVGVEGTGAYGAGLVRDLTAEGVRVVEVNRPDRRQRRLKGKSDPLDAYAAADAVWSERATVTTKLGTGIVEAIRAMHGEWVLTLIENDQCCPSKVTTRRPPGHRRCGWTPRARRPP
jgi:transposase